MVRREFLKNGLLWTAYGYLLSRSSGVRADGSADPRDYLVIADTISDTGVYQDHVKMISRDADGFVCTMDVATGEIRRFPVPIWAHVYNQHPTAPHVVLGVAKWTPSGVAVDLRNGKILAHIKAPNGYRFFGHAVFDPAGKHAYVSADSAEGKAGGLCVYNTESWKFERILDAGCRTPHEIIWTHENRIAVAGIDAKTFKTGVVCLTNPLSGNLERAFPSPKLSHMIRLDSDRLALTGGTDHLECQAVVLNMKTGDLRDVHSASEFPKPPFSTEALSLVALSPDELAMTLNGAKKLMFWNLKTNSVKIQGYSGPTQGLAVVGNRLYMTYSHSGNLVQIDLDRQLASAEASKNPYPVFGNGKHMRAMRF